MDPRAIVVGGGLAGLAAAVALAARDFRVDVVEARPRLGGRASSYFDKTTETDVDNCQHVSLGCCTNFAHFCQTVGWSHSFQRESVLYFVAHDGKINRLKSSYLPAPLHLMPSMVRFSFLNSADRRGISRAMRVLSRENIETANDRTFAEWLDEQRQTQNAIERFWSVVLTSALSESLDRIDTLSARKVFIDGFLANRHGWEVLVPTVPLEELYGSSLSDWLTSHGVTVHTNSRVVKLSTERDAVTGVELRGGQQLTADDFIVAVPHHHVRSLLPASLRDDRKLEEIDRIESAPISSVHLWFDRPITTLPHAVFIDRLSQWMFNRNALMQNESPPYYYQVVISASRQLQSMSQSEVISAVVNELSAIWPTASAAEIQHARLITEHRAVFSVLPGTDSFRPPQQSPIANLQLAGDWTRTGWPATMEGAVRSGYLAAENVLARHGCRDQLVEADLPTAWLSRRLLRL